MAAEPQRPDGWIVTFLVEVVFDTNASHTGYDHVGTVSRCTGCGERIDAASSPAGLLRHARLHEPTCVSDGEKRSESPAMPRRNSRGRQPTITRLPQEEVTTEHTTA